MKMQHLLAGVATAAILSGAANAQGFFDVTSDDGAAPNLSGTPPTGDQWFASELGNLNGVTVPFEFNLVPDDAADVFAASSNVEGLLTVTVTNAVLDSSLGAGSMVGGGACGAAPGQSFTVDAGGVSGQSTVTFRIADIAACDGAAGGGAAADVAWFAFPLLLQGGNVDVSFELRRASNNALIGSGSWSDGNNNGTFGGTAGDDLVEQISAIDVDTTTDIAIADSGAATPFAGFLGGSDTLGTFAIDVTGALLADGSPVVAGDVDAAELLCTFGSVAGLVQNSHTWFSGVSTNQLPTQATTTTENPVPFTIPTGEFGSTNTLQLVANGVVPIQQQDVSCAGSVEFDAATGLSDFTISSFPIGRIRRDGPTTGLFEWVGDSTLSTGNVFRITGLGTTSPGASVIVTNSSAGMNGEYPLNLPTPTNGEVIINNAILTNQIGAFGRADLQFSFHDATLDNAGGDGVIVRRFMVGANGTLFDMGDDNSDEINTRTSDVLPQDDAGGGNN